MGQKTPADRERAYDRYSIGRRKRTQFSIPYDTSLDGSFGTQHAGRDPDIHRVRRDQSDLDERDRHSHVSFAGVAPRRVVLSYGVFDMFTPTHALRLQAMSRLGQDLIIGCATDSYCDALGLCPQMGFAQRREMLESCRFVSRVIAQDAPDQHRTDIVNYDVGLLVMPAQWVGHFDDLQDLAQVYYLPPTLHATPLVRVDQLQRAIAL